MKQYAILVIDHSNNVAAVKLPVILLESDLPDGSVLMMLLCVAIHMKTVEQYFLVALVLFILSLLSNLCVLLH